MGRIMVKKLLHEANMIFAYHDPIKSRSRLASKIRVFVANYCHCLLGKQFEECVL